jgi:Flp pilus assembly protein TadD
VLQNASQRSKITRLFAIAASSAILALGLCGCQTSGPSDVTGSIGSIGEKADASRSANPRQDLSASRERHRANPKDVDAAIQYGKALRATGQKSQAVAVLEQASIANPGNRLLLAGYGRALADNGNFQQAFDVLGRAHSPEDPDWRLLSVQGAALDQLGRYDEARQYYTSALKVAPDEPVVLSNLGLSYVLSKDLPKAEETLRRAHSLAKSDPRIRANLAMVVGLQGKAAEAESIAKADLPPEEAAANVANLKRLLSRKEARAENARAEARKLPVAPAKQSD